MNKRKRSVISREEQGTSYRYLDDGIPRNYRKRLEEHERAKERRRRNRELQAERNVAEDVKHEEWGDEAFVLPLEEEMDGFYIDEDKSDVQVAGELDVPAYVYNNLYPFQKDSINWFWKLHQQNAGGVLGDEMGLGKTVQIIAFIASLVHNKLIDTALILCPASVLLHWLSQLHKWYPPLRVCLLHASGSGLLKMLPSQLIRNVAADGGVLITTYEAARQNQQTILEINWDYAILDEGHRIRNPDAEITLVCKQLRTAHRILATGAPIQNNLKELWSLYDFVFPGRLGTLPTFEDEFVLPIRQGGYVNASRWQIVMAYKTAIILRDLIDPYLLRRMKKDVSLSTNLPEKTEQVIFCKLNKSQLGLYKDFLSSAEVECVLDRSFKPFRALGILRKICNHVSMVDHEATSSLDITKPSPTSARTVVDGSGKMLVIDKIFPLWKSQGHRILLFSQTRTMLDLLEHYVVCMQWSYCRLDGTTPVKKRQELIDTFMKDESIFIFLLTTRAGGIGINLMGADRVLIYDPDWNPSTDIQARERAWRLGQTKPVTIYRLITCGTIEEKIYHRQIFKNYLTNKVLKDPKQRRCFNKHHLRDLFMLGEQYSSSSSIKTGTATSTGTETGDLFLAGHVNHDVPPLNNAKESSSASRSFLGGDAEDIQMQNCIADVGEVKSTIQLESGGTQNNPSADSDSERDVGKADGDGDNDTILRKLFDSSDVQSVFSHDALEAEGIQNQEIELVEMEASKMACRAVDALSRSQNSIRRQRTGVHIPTWTGKNGSAGSLASAVPSSKPRFGSVASRISASGTGNDSSSRKNDSTALLDGRRFSSSGGSSGDRGGFDQNRGVSEGFSSQHKQVAVRSELMLSKLKQKQQHRRGVGVGTETTYNSMEELASDLTDYLSAYEREGGALTDSLLARFGPRVRLKDKLAFRALLRTLADFENGKWNLKSSKV